MSTKRRTAAQKRAEILEKYGKTASESVFCRTCLGTQNLVSIFCSSHSEQKMSRDLKLVTGLEIRINDGLSQNICQKCLEIFNLSLQFRRKSKETEKTLLSMLSRDVTDSNGYSINADDNIYPKIKSLKTEVEESYEETSNGNDFQNNDEFDCKDDVKPVIKEDKQEEAAPLLQVRPIRRRQRHAKIPDAPLYKCSLCSNEYRRKATYKAHIRLHTNGCVCETCGKLCRNDNDLQVHKRARHGLGRILKCAYCEYSSAAKDSLTIHERRHTGERPYTCDHCGATFHRRSNLVQHIAIHLPEKNFQCTFCPTREKSKKRLQMHISKNHRVKRYSYKCPCCFKLFQRNEHTHRHLERVHHIPRSEHQPIERVLIEGDKDGYRPLPYECNQVYHNDGNSGTVAF